MDRIRTDLYRTALVVLIAVCVSLGVYLGVRYSRTASIDTFAREYAAADNAGRVGVAEKYLRSFPASELLSAVEADNASLDCHVQAHPLGRAVYKLNSNFSESIRQCGNACTYGCFHGAMMEMFATESDTLGGAVEDEAPEDYLAHVKELAPDLCDRPEVKSEVRSRFCTHGIGHTFAVIAHDDLDGAIRSCDVLRSRLAVSSCVTGVFMEYMFDPAHVDELESKGNAPCDRYPDYAEPCLRYKSYGWIRAWGGVEPALAACDTLGKNALTCIRTVGEATSSPKLRATKEGFNDMCGSLSGEKFRTCVAGALLKIVDINNGEDSDRLCDEVAPEYRDACLRVIRSYLAAVALNE